MESETLSYKNQQTCLALMRKVCLHIISVSAKFESWFSQRGIIYEIACIRFLRHGTAWNVSLYVGT